jgi:hypothetical protein
MENLTWASSPTARGIVQKRLDWFVADGDGLDDVGDVITIQPWMSLANGSAATDHATIVTELTWDHQRAAEDQREKPRRTKVNWQIARRGRFLQDMEALLHEAATPIKELYQLELYAEVQEYGDRTHDAIIELYDTHRKEIERGRRAGSKKAKRALSRYVIETLQGRTADDVSHGYFDRASQLRLAYEDEARHETTSRVTTERDFFDTKSLFAQAKGHRGVSSGDYGRQSEEKCRQDDRGAVWCAVFCCDAVCCVVCCAVGVSARVRVRRDEM